MVHATCRSCHVPPDTPGPGGLLTDCAVCHLPERPPESIRLLLSVAALVPRIEFDESVPAGLREAFRTDLLATIDDAGVRVVPEGSNEAAAVSILVSTKAAPVRLDAGREFHASRARATVRIHRVAVELESAPGVAWSRDEAIEDALADLAERVLLVLTW